MKGNLPFLMLALMGLYTCGRENRFPGYKDTGNGTYYKLHKIGENPIKARPGDYITVNLEYRTIKDSVFFSGTRKLRLGTPEYDGSIDACFAMLAEDDSATFIINAGDFFTKTLHNGLPEFIPPGGSLKINAEMVDIQTEAEYEYEKNAFLSWIEDIGNYEKMILKQFIATEKLPVKPLPSGIYYLIIRPGTGKKVEPGDTLTVHYEGRFLNGKFFDSTIRRQQPFQFIYGTEWQVIKGLEEAIGMMHEGERSLFILPSEQGFGSHGSSTGIIPPFTSLIFEVEILKVSSSGKI